MSASPWYSLNLADHVGDDPAAVAENRRRVAAALGSTDLAAMACVHGGDVAVVDGPGTVADVDALVTVRPGLVLLAQGADCVPLAIVGRDGAAVAAVHCGWRGLVADIVGAAVAEVTRLAGGVAAVVIGPAVCGQCYPVPAERADEVRRLAPVGRSPGVLVRTADRQPGIDVRAGVEARLVDLGVPRARIARVAGCTVEDAGLFSHRRDGVTGRQGIAVRIDPEGQG